VDKELERLVENKTSSSQLSSTLLYPSVDSLLRSKMREIQFGFNLLPPDNRLSIPKLGIQAPIINVVYYTPQKLRDGDFDKELYKGVVRYPNTASPGQTGNVLIF